MGKILGFDELATKVDEDDLGKHDVQRRSDRLQWFASSERAVLGLDGVNTNPYSFTDWALSQMLTKLGIPRAYWDKCNPALQTINGNYWLFNRWNNGRNEDRRDNMLFRAKDQQIRGVLSDRYSVVNNNDFVAALYPLAEKFQLQIHPHQIFLEDTTFHVRVLVPQMTKSVRTHNGQEDYMSLGFHFGNSEVGAKRLSIRPFLYRQVCTNGLIVVGEKFQGFDHKHIGMSRHSLIAALNFSLAGALQEGDLYMEMIEKAAHFSFAAPEETINTLLEKRGYGAPVQKAAIRFWETEDIYPRDNSLFGVVNAMTRVAQTLPTEDRFDLEEFAGIFLRQGVLQNA